MISMAPNLPPVTLTDEAMKLAATLLQIAADPSGTQARLAELSAQMAAIRSAIDEHAAAKTQAETAAAALADVERCGEPRGQFAQGNHAAFGRQPRECFPRGRLEYSLAGARQACGRD
jgi:hypothetical protein